MKLRITVRTVVLVLISLLSFSKVLATQNEQRIMAASGDLTLPSSAVVVNSQFKMYYEIDGTDLIMLVQVTNYGWIGVGFQSTMSDCDMVIFTTENMVAKVTDTYSSGESTPSTDSQQDWILLGSDIQATSFIIKAKRALNTGDSQDQTLTQDSKYSFCAGWSSTRYLEKHDDYISYAVTLSNNLGETAVSVVDTGVSKQALSIHKVVLFYGWGIGVDISIFVARYLKTWKHYINVHALIFFILNVATIVLEAIVIDGNKSKLDSVSTVDKDVKNHYIIGCVVLALVILQHLGGVVLKFAIEGTNQKVALIKKFHQIFGIILYILCKVNILIGSDIDSSIGGGVIIVIVSFIFLVFSEIFRRIYDKKTRHLIYDYNYVQVGASEAKEKQDSECADLMRMINVEKRETSQIISAMPHLKWVVFNQGIYDITNFVHPGGQYIMKDIVGKEIGRYLFGSVPLEGFNFTPHSHSASAITSLRSSLIGYLNYGESNIFEIDGKKTSNNKLRLFNPFKIVKTDKISSTTSKFYFRNPSIQIKNVIKGINWIGRHFQVKVSDENKSRLYTQLNCMTDDNVILRNQLINYAKTVINNEPPVPIDIQQYSQYSSSLPLIIKKYDFEGALSKTIHEENKSKEYSIQGPLGIGLGFGEHTKNKRIAIMCVGTGVLPFLDLFDFLLKKQLLEKLPEHQKELDPLNLEYQKFFIGCQFSVYSGFATINDFIGFEWINYLNQLSKQQGNKLFNLSLKLSKGSVPEGVTKISDKSYGNYILKNITNSMFDKIYVCGPPLMFNEVMESLKEKGFDQSKIIIV